MRPRAGSALASRKRFRTPAPWRYLFPTASPPAPPTHLAARDAGSQRSSPTTETAAAARAERLRYIHSACLTLLISEIRQSSERIAAFLVGTSVLAAGFVASVQSASTSPMTSAFTIVIPSLGFAFSLLIIGVMGRGKSAADFWRSTLALIEADAGFWHPGRTTADTDLDLTTARVRYWQGKVTRQGSDLLQLSRNPRGLSVAARVVRDPLVALAFWTPLVLAGLWLAAASSMILDACGAIAVR